MREAPCSMPPEVHGRRSASLRPRLRGARHMTHTLRGDDAAGDIIETSCFAGCRPSTSQRHVIMRCATLQSVTYTPSLAGQNERAVAVLACHWTNLGPPRFAEQSQSQRGESSRSSSLVTQDSRLARVRVQTTYPETALRAPTPSSSQPAQRRRLRRYSSVTMRSQRT